MLVSFAIIWALCNDDYSQYLGDSSRSHRLLRDYHHSIINPRPLLQIIDHLEANQVLTIITVNPDLEMSCQFKVFGNLTKCYLNYLTRSYPDTIIELPAAVGLPASAPHFTLGSNHLYLLRGHYSLRALFYDLPDEKDRAPIVALVNQWWLTAYPAAIAVMGSQQLFRYLLTDREDDLITAMRDYEYESDLPSVTPDGYLQPSDSDDWDSLLPFYYQYEIPSDGELSFIETRVIKDYHVKCHYYREGSEVVFVILPPRSD